MIVLSSSLNILKYLVNDILDLGQLKAGKFRKNSSIFNISSAIQEVILI